MFHSVPQHFLEIMYKTMRVSLDVTSLFVLATFLLSPRAPCSDRLCILQSIVLLMRFCVYLAPHRRQWDHHHQHRWHARQMAKPDPEPVYHIANLLHWIKFEKKLRSCIPMLICGDAAIFWVFFWTSKHHDSLRLSERKPFSDPIIIWIYFRWHLQTVVHRMLDTSILHSSSPETPSCCCVYMLVQNSKQIASLQSLLDMVSPSESDEEHDCDFYGASWEIMAGWPKFYLPQMRYL